jgi:hypothetical protein
MRILYLGSTQPTACASFYADAAEKLGHEVFRWDPKLFQSGSPIEKLKTRITKNPSQYRIALCEEMVVQQCQELKIDLVLNLAENFLSVSVLTAIRSLSNRPKIIYHSHDNNFAPGILRPSDFFESLALYDCVFTTKSQNLQRYKMLGQAFSFYIPCAYEPRFHRPIPPAESKLGGRMFEVAFVGTYDHSRERFLNAVGWDKLYVWGDRWKKFTDFSSHKDHIVPHAVYLSDFADVLSQSKIALGLLREEVEDRHTQRTFEIPACGSFQIAPRNDEILTYFEEDKEIVCFESLEELKDKTDFYLRNPDQRSQIAKAGYDKVTRSHHTYEDRVKTMLEKTQLT